ncbi:MAG: DUF1015 domain-containing protein [Methylococcales bacterium]|jgi:uncharacterized protein (DUF1015 family)|nr:DUF1015 domain-containing protein [Methylococcales bacterium]MBT7410268.1 DUF1015 domain-containing protein [Methylococcales bacterium]
MPLIRPFAGLRPTTEYHDQVVAPPYDVLNTAEAKVRAQDKPWSFLHISKPEIDLADDISPYDASVYQKGASNLSSMIEKGVLKQDQDASYYVYKLIMGEHQQLGIMAVASVAEYDVNRIKKHEFTRPKKEDDRVRQIEVLNAQTGPVFLVYKANQLIDNALADIAKNKPDMDVTADDGVQHSLWKVSDESWLNSITSEFDQMESIYIADGHHRSAAASRVAKNKTQENAAEEQPHDYFLSVIFPHNQMQILDYNRVITDLNGLSNEAFLEKVSSNFTVKTSSQPYKPDANAKFGLYLNKQWYSLEYNGPSIDDPVKQLDVSLLANYLIEPILNINDPRTDSRIDFVGGIRGLGGLEKRVDSGEMAVAFSLFPTSMDQLMAVADVNQVMPPKSTWFEPKLADGLVSHLI